MKNDFVFLIKVDENNVNRIFSMHRSEGNDFFLTQTGRYGAKLVERKFPISAWDSVLKKHLDDGFVDRTEETTVKIVNSNPEYAPIKDRDVADLVYHLQRYARQMIKDSYTVSTEEVSELALSKAQDIISRMTKCHDKEAFNKLLLELFVAIPRKMKDVTAMLAKDSEDIADILEREQDLLDVMASEVRMHDVSKAAKLEKTILEALHLDIRPCTCREIDDIKKHLGKESQGCFKRAFRVVNRKTQKRFDAYCVANGISPDDVHFYYHGSKNANYFGITSEGLSLNPKAPITGKMFGYGLYFANRAKKSINYTDLTGSYWVRGHSKRAYLAVFQVAYKNPKHVQTWSPYMGTLTKRSLAPNDALFAHKGDSLVNDEIIVYDEAQCSIKYLIEIGC